MHYLQHDNGLKLCKIGKDAYYTVWMHLAKVGLLNNSELLTSPFVLHTFSIATREFNPFTRLSNGFLPDSRAAETKIEKKVA